MTVAIQNKFFADNGQPITGATVQAILTNGTTTSVSATDTTTVDGLWAFDTSVVGHQASLADTAATYWYDFKISYGSIVRWHYGGVKLYVRAVNLAQGVIANATTTFDFTAASVVVKCPLALTTAGGLLLTLPTTVDTLVGRNTTDTLTAKTLTSPVINGGTGTWSGTLSGISTLTAATLVGTLGTPSQSAVTSLGTLSSLVVAGTLGVGGGIAGTLTTSNQPYVTSLGTLSSLQTSGSVTVGANATIVSSGGYMIMAAPGDLYLRPLGITHIDTARLDMGGNNITSVGALSGATLNATGNVNCNTVQANSGNSLLQGNTNDFNSNSLSCRSQNGNTWFSVRNDGAINAAGTFTVGNSAIINNGLTVNGIDNGSVGMAINVGNQAGSMLMQCRDDGNANNTRVAWTVTSTRDVKDDIRSVSNGLEIIQSLRPVHYVRTDIDQPLREFGLIAEEVHDVLPQVVGYAEDGSPSGVRYENLVGPLIAAIQELAARVAVLEARG